MTAQFSVDLVEHLRDSEQKSMRLSFEENDTVFSQQSVLTGMLVHGLYPVLVDGDEFFDFIVNDIVSPSRSNMHDGSS